MFRRRDEYASYVGGIVRLRYAGASDLDRMLCHAKLETEAMGLQPRPVHRLRPVVDALRAITDPPPI
jgi:hypothetical protein